MVILDGTCPHCGQIKGFKIFALGDHSRIFKPEMVVKDRIGRQENIEYNLTHYAASCLQCHEPIVGIIEFKEKDKQEIQRCISNQSAIFDGQRLKNIKIIPEPTPPYSHPALPDKVRLLFVDLQKMLNQELSPSMIIGGCRAVVETAVKDLGGTGSNMRARIEDLKSKAVVNGVLADWATHVRLEGNEALHELEGTPKEAKELVEFTKLFLQYTFEFPARVLEAQGD